MRRMFLILVALMGGCDTSSRERDGSSADVQPSIDAAVDMMNDDSGSVDAEPLLDSAISADASTPIVRTTPEAECDGQDNDNDGSIDEGATNVCGGCGGLPPEGCQLWNINFSQAAETTLNVNRLVSL